MLGISQSRETGKSGFTFSGGLYTLLIDGIFGWGHLKTLVGLMVNRLAVPEEPADLKKYLKML